MSDDNFRQPSYFHNIPKCCLPVLCCGSDTVPRSEPRQEFTEFPTEEPQHNEPDNKTEKTNTSAVRDTKVQSRFARGVTRIPRLPPVDDPLKNEYFTLDWMMPDDTVAKANAVESLTQGFDNNIGRVRIINVRPSADAIEEERSNIINVQAADSDSDARTPEKQPTTVPVDFGKISGVRIINVRPSADAIEDAEASPMDKQPKPFMTEIRSAEILVDEHKRPEYSFSPEESESLADIYTVSPLATTSDPGQAPSPQPAASLAETKSVDGIDEQPKKTKKTKSKKNIFKKLLSSRSVSSDRKEKKSQAKDMEKKEEMSEGESQTKKQKKKEKKKKKKNQKKVKVGAASREVSPLALASKPELPTSPQPALPANKTTGSGTDLPTPPQPALAWGSKTDLSTYPQPATALVEPKVADASVESETGKEKKSSHNLLRNLLSGHSFSSKRKEKTNSDAIDKEKKEERQAKKLKKKEKKKKKQRQVKVGPASVEDDQKEEEPFKSMATLTREEILLAHATSRSETDLPPLRWAWGSETELPTSPQPGTSAECRPIDEPIEDRLGKKKKKHPIRDFFLEILQRRNKRKLKQEKKEKKDKKDTKKDDKSGEANTARDDTPSQINIDTDYERTNAEETAVQEISPVQSQLTLESVSRSS